MRAAPFVRCPGRVYEPVLDDFAETVFRTEATPVYHSPRPSPLISVVTRYCFPSFIYYLC